MHAIYTKFQLIELSAEEQKFALCPNEYFLAYLQNKMAMYAHQLLEMKLDINPDPSQQMHALMEIQRLQNFVAAYDELLAEIQDFASVGADTQPNPN
jgi:hypothetical protein